MNRKQAIRAVSFLALMALLLHIVSVVSMRVTRDRKPVYSVFSLDIKYEPKDSIDVIAFGSSNVYSAIMPLEWWNTYGFTGYDYAEASQRAPEMKLAVKRIYKKQSPKVILLDVATLFKETTDIDAYDSTVKAYLQEVFPVISYHRFLLKPHRWKALTAQPGSLTKGYLIRGGIEAGEHRDYMKKTKRKKTYEINPVIKKQFKDTIAYCKDHGSEVVLIEVPENAGWNRAKHNVVKRFAKEVGLTFLDLNLAMKNEINWETDTADGGAHMNYIGARKVTDYLGYYLMEKFNLEDRRKTLQNAEEWNEDYKLQNEEIQRLLEGGESVD